MSYVDFHITCSQVGRSPWHDAWPFYVVLLLLDLWRLGRVAWLSLLDASLRFRLVAGACSSLVFLEECSFFASNSGNSLTSRCRTIITVRGVPSCMIGKSKCTVISGPVISLTSLSFPTVPTNGILFHLPMTRSPMKYLGS